MEAIAPAITLAIVQRQNQVSVLESLGISVLSSILGPGSTTSTNSGQSTATPSSQTTSSSSGTASTTSGANSATSSSSSSSSMDSTVLRASQTTSSSSTPTGDPKNNNGSNHTLPIILGAVLGAVLLAMIAIVVCLLVRRRNHKRKVVYEGSIRSTDDDDIDQIQHHIMTDHSYTPAPDLHRYGIGRASGGTPYRQVPSENPFNDANATIASVPDRPALERHRHSALGVVPEHSIPGTANPPLRNSTWSDYSGTTNHRLSGDSTYGPWVPPPTTTSARRKPVPTLTPMVSKEAGFDFGLNERERAKLNRMSDRRRSSSSSLSEAHGRF